jgi:hypothetical protein
MRKFLITITVLFSQLSFACFAPRGGPEYDKLINLEKLEEKNTYKVTVPQRLEELQDAEIMLAYSKDHPGGVPIYESCDVLEAKALDGELSATFSVEKRKNEKPYIVVMWWPNVCCPCGIQANTGYLEVE